jgi:hypothetical protein
LTPLVAFHFYFINCRLVFLLSALTLAPPPPSVLLLLVEPCLAVQQVATQSLFKAPTLTSAHSAQLVLTLLLLTKLALRVLVALLPPLSEALLLVPAKAAMLEAFPLLALLIVVLVNPERELF